MYCSANQSAAQGAASAPTLDAPLDAPLHGPLVAPFHATLEVPLVAPLMAPLHAPLGALLLGASLETSCGLPSMVSASSAWSMMPRMRHLPLASASDHPAIWAGRFPNPSVGAAFGIAVPHPRLWPSAMKIPPKHPTTKTCSNHGLRSTKESFLSCPPKSGCASTTHASHRAMPDTRLRAPLLHREAPGPSGEPLDLDCSTASMAFPSPALERHTRCFPKACVP